MAGSYVQISRDDLEEWLDGLPYQWSRVQGRAGIYLIHLSRSVAVKLSSTIGSNDDARGLGKASMQLSLVSRITGQVLNKKAQGQSHFKRTKNWRATWLDGIRRMQGAYMKAQGFYDAIAEIEDRDRYKKETLGKIESVDGWRNHDILSDFHKKVMQDGVLTSKQMALVDRLMKANSKPSAPSGRDEDFYQRVRHLYSVARDRGDQWLMNFLKNVGPRVRDGQPLSPKQVEVLDRNLDRYNV